MLRTIFGMCNHDYFLINHFEMMSEFDIVCSHGYTPNSWNSLKRTYVTDYKCQKCGKIKG
jgi:hypothetical protein